eukprot:5628818-Amphidinium_carterae.1
MTAWDGLPLIQNFGMTTQDGRALIQKAWNDNLALWVTWDGLALIKKGVRLDREALSYKGLYEGGSSYTSFVLATKFKM